MADRNLIRMFEDTRLLSGRNAFDEGRKNQSIVIVVDARRLLGVAGRRVGESGYAD